MPRRLFLGILPILLIALVVGGWWAWCWLTAPFPVQAYGRLRLGMTTREAWTAVGVLPGEYFSKEWSPNGPMPDDVYRMETGMPWDDGISLRSRSFDKWWWDTHELFVVYDESGQVIGFYLLERPNSRPTLLQRLLVWLGI